MKKVDVLIVGGGILAWVLAQRISRLNTVKSAVIISSRELHTSSLRNQSWLQSGLLYNLDDSVEREVAELCIFHGRKLMDLRNERMLRQAAIMAVKSEEEAEKKISFLRAHGFIYPNHYLNTNEAREKLGNDFLNSESYSKGSKFIWTPDQPFDEGGLLRFCEDSISFANFKFSSIKGNAVLKKNALTKNGYSVQVDNEEFDPGVLFVLTGLNTIRFLEPLGIEENIKIKARRCVLMKSLNFIDLKVPIFINKINNTNINTVKDLSGKKLHLLGDSIYTPVENIHQLPKDMNVTTQDKELFLQNFCQSGGYPDLKSKLELFLEDDNNFSVCYKTESAAYLPWIYDSNTFDQCGYKNIYMAGPGKATLAFHTATELLRIAKLGEGIEQTSQLRTNGNSEIKMWFEEKQTK
ncbi:FAD-dependent oxidoreductase [Chitinophaga rhizophila]|uniref:FAD-binding oxidoreductase n=1 Tax=Chitinophaga rhizophila TaxID=2866212 RepID=A0ABS7G946_9BACT|nr:FAD-dependent oxidoreductase [Chitinophaga rhizophila]MBW8683309.1 FAD-binding oxidoreductase [Chitinophaga rhizophila]